MGIPGLFFLYFFSMYFHIEKFADYWIRTADLWYSKFPLYQLSSVIRSGDLWDFGQLLKAFGNK